MIQSFNDLVGAYARHIAQVMGSANSSEAAFRKAALWQSYLQAAGSLENLVYILCQIEKDVNGAKQFQQPKDSKEAKEWISEEIAKFKKEIKVHYLVDTISFEVGKDKWETVADISYQKAAEKNLTDIWGKIDAFMEYMQHLQKTEEEHAELQFEDLFRLKETDLALSKGQVSFEEYCEFLCDVREWIQNLSWNSVSKELKEYSYHHFWSILAPYCASRTWDTTVEGIRKKIATIHDKLKKEKDTFKRKIMWDQIRELHVDIQSLINMKGNKRFLVVSSGEASRCSLRDMENSNFKDIQLRKLEKSTQKVAKMYRKYIKNLQDGLFASKTKLVDPRTLK